MGKLTLKQQTKITFNFNSDSVISLNRRILHDFHTTMCNGNGTYSETSTSRMRQVVIMPKHFFIIPNAYDL